MKLVLKAPLKNEKEVKVYLPTDLDLQDIEILRRYLDTLIRVFYRRQPIIIGPPEATP